ncbi:hypothetical protein ACFLSX_00720 [Calditrichota bacterium]
MKHITFLLSIVLMFTFFTAADAGEKGENWEKFSKSLVETLKSDNEGLKQSAMMQIMVFCDSLDVKDAAFDVYNIYKFHKDNQMRHLALVTLYHLKSDWAMIQLTKDLKTEESPLLKKQIMFMVKEYNQMKEHVH